MEYCDKLHFIQTRDYFTHYSLLFGRQYSGPCPGTGTCLNKFSSVPAVFTFSSFFPVLSTSFSLYFPQVFFPVFSASFSLYFPQVFFPVLSASFFPVLSATVFPLLSASFSLTFRKFFPELSASSHTTRECIPSTYEPNFDSYPWISKIPSCEPELYASDVITVFM